MSRTEWALACAGVLGFAVAALGHDALGWRWLTYAGVLVAGIALVWLAVLAQQMPPAVNLEAGAAAPNRTRVGVVFLGSRNTVRHRAIAAGERAVGRGSGGRGGERWRRRGCHFQDGVRAIPGVESASDGEVRGDSARGARDGKHKTP
jgi:hypothetical protein